MSGASFTNIFGGNAIKPSDPSYEALSIAVNTTLFWPLETIEGSPVVADLIDVTATVGGLALAMPPATQGSTGVATIVANVGGNTFRLTDNGGNTIASIAASQAWVIALTTNVTANGTWRAYQLASTTSSGSAGALAGYGLSVEGGTALQVNWTRQELSTNTALGVSSRANNIVWTGGVGTIQLGASATLGAGWIAAFTNEGTDALTITGTGGETINGQASVVLQPGNSGFIIAGAGKFDTYGVLIDALGIIDGGTGATTAGGALTNLGGTSIGVAIFTAPSAASVISLLGIPTSAYTESTVTTDQSLSNSSSGTAYVVGADVNFGLPLSTTLTTKWYVAVTARLGSITLQPQISDSINGGTAGNPFVIPVGQSVLIVTDAAGNFYTMFLQPSLISNVNVAGSSNVAIPALLAQHGILELNGAVTGDIFVIVPASPGQWIVRNQTTGGHVIQFGAVGGVNTIPLSQGFNRAVWTDGATMYVQDSDPLDVIPYTMHEQVFTTPGAISFTPDPGVTFIYVDEVLGAGGGGGATSDTGGGQASAASGGNSGTRGGGVLAVTPGVPVTGAVGGGGNGGTVVATVGGNGTDGTATSFGPITSPGGHGGLGDGAARTPPFATGQNPAINASGGGAWSDGEISGQPGIIMTATDAFSGAGGGPGGGGPRYTTGVGNAAVTAGGGGGGALTLASGSGQAGGNGHAGRVRIRW